MKLIQTVAATLGLFYGVVVVADDCSDQTQWVSSETEDTRTCSTVLTGAIDCKLDDPLLMIVSLSSETSNFTVQRYGAFGVPGMEIACAVAYKSVPASQSSKLGECNGSYSSYWSGDTTGPGTGYYVICQNTFDIPPYFWCSVSIDTDTQKTTSPITMVLAIDSESQCIAAFTPANPGNSGLLIGSDAINNACNAAVLGGGKFTSCPF
ncbi:MAG: hypothetical protein A3F18_04630 [Legionellales bacterium RIFCSPHIGHO2_12_FULL_37_14]|nr:MAG: hypothetical protein A3F18_04630 [Legionellales bacterium RIFCSPHIGHO2_12_FULL_37_14]